MKLTKNNPYDRLLKHLTSFDRGEVFETDDLMEILSLERKTINEVYSKLISDKYIKIIAETEEDGIIMVSLKDEGRSFINHSSYFDIERKERKSLRKNNVIQVITAVTAIASCILTWVTISQNKEINRLENQNNHLTKKLQVSSKQMDSLQKLLRKKNGM